VLAATLMPEMRRRKLIGHWNSLPQPHGEEVSPSDLKPGKAHLQELATATAANVFRIANWLNSIPTTARQRCRLAALAQAS
jgi:hypothetical protein